MTQHTIEDVLEKLDELRERQDSHVIESHRKRFWDLVYRLTGCAVLVGLGWMANTEKRVTRLEDVVDQLREPPKWLRNDVDTIKATLKDIETRMRALEIHNGGEKRK